jgi:hypothetical protein
MFYIEGISDNSFGEGKDTHISVYGYVVHFCGVPLATKLKLGRRLLCHQLKQNILPSQKWLKKYYLSNNQWTQLEYQSSCG